MEMIAWQNISFVIEGGYYGRFGNNTITVNNGTNYKEKQTSGWRRCWHILCVLEANLALFLLIWCP